MSSVFDGPRDNAHGIVISKHEPILTPTVNVNKCVYSISTLFSNMSLPILLFIWLNTGQLETFLAGKGKWYDILRNVRFSQMKTVYDKS